MPLDIVINRQSHEEWHKILLLVVGIPGVATFPFVMYLIIKKSNANMQEYKWYIANGVLINFISTLLMVLLRPVILLPYGLIYYNGLNFLVNWKISEFLLEIAQFMLANGALGLLICLIHIYHVMNQMNFGGFLSKRWHTIALILILYLLVFGLIGICISCNQSRENLRNESLKYDEELDIFFQEHDLFTGISKDCPRRWIIFPYAFICGVVVFALGIFLNVKLYRLLHQNQQYIMPETRKMQMILYKTYTVQSIVFCLCFGTPGLVVNITAIIGLFNYFFASLYTVSVITLHLFLNNLVVMFSVKSYRTFILEKVNLILNLFGIRIQCLSTNNITRVVSMFNPNNYNNNSEFRF